MLLLNTDSMIERNKHQVYMSPMSISCMVILLQKKRTTWPTKNINDLLHSKLMNKTLIET